MKGSQAISSLRMKPKSMLLPTKSSQAKILVKSVARSKPLRTSSSLHKTYNKKYMCRMSNKRPRKNDHWSTLGSKSKRIRSAKDRLTIAKLVQIQEPNQIFETNFKSARAIALLTSRSLMFSYPARINTQVHSQVRWGTPTRGPKMSSLQRAKSIRKETSSNHMTRLEFTMKVQWVTTMNLGLRSQISSKIAIRTWLPSPT